MQGADYREISARNRPDYRIHKISHETNCLLVPLCLINVNVAPAFETTKGSAQKKLNDAKELFFYCLHIFFN